jgi:hypothetical protein
MLLSLIASEASRAAPANDMPFVSIIKAHLKNCLLAILSNML